SVGTSDLVRAQVMITNAVAMMMTAPMSRTRASFMKPWSRSVIGALLLPVRLVPGDARSGGEERGRRAGPPPVRPSRARLAAGRRPHGAGRDAGQGHDLPAVDGGDRVEVVGEAPLDAPGRRGHDLGQDPDLAVVGQRLGHDPLDPHV